MKRLTSHHLAVLSAPEPCSAPGYPPRCRRDVAGGWQPTIKPFSSPYLAAPDSGCGAGAGCRQRSLTSSPSSEHPQSPLVQVQPAMRINQRILLLLILLLPHLAEGPLDGGKYLLTAAFPGRGSKPPGLRWSSPPAPPSPRPAAPELNQEHRPRGEPRQQPSGCSQAQLGRCWEARRDWGGFPGGCSQLHPSFTRVPHSASHAAPHCWARLWCRGWVWDAQSSAWPGTSLAQTLPVVPSSSSSRAGAAGDCTPREGSAPTLGSDPSSTVSPPPLHVPRIHEHPARTSSFWGQPQGRCPSLWHHSWEPAGIQRQELMFLPRQMLWF